MSTRSIESPLPESSNAVKMDEFKGLKEYNSIVNKVKTEQNFKKFDDTIHEVLCKEFLAKTAVLPTHRQYLLKKVIDLLKIITNPSEDVQERQISSAIGKLILVENSRDVHVGDKVKIVEQIVLNADKNELEWKGKNISRDYTNHFQMIDRMHWLAQPSVSEINTLSEPVKFVIICHTCTQEAYTQAENILILRLMQTYHIESKGWADIAYNFCIGSDGNVYEGRGWFSEGAHTMSYNKYSIGIAFIGCFLDNLPPKTSLMMCKKLIKHGVKIGAIQQDYELIGQSQCRPFLSPGPRLFQEIRTWTNFNSNIENTKPCNLLSEE